MIEATHILLISKWLKSKNNFFVGSVLYEKFGTDDKLKSLFSDCTTPDDYLKKRLEQELIDLSKKTDLPLISLSKPVQSLATGDMPVSDDAVLKALRNEWLPLYQKMNYLRHELDRVASEEFPLYNADVDQPDNSPMAIAKRKPIAFEILELEQQCMLIWHKRDHYIKSGQLPEAKEKKTELPADPVELGKLIETLKRNVRRNKQKMDQHPDKVVYALKYQQYKAQLDEILEKQKPAL